VHKTLTHEHLLKQENHSSHTEEKNQDTNEKDNATGNLVISGSGVGVEESRASQLVVTFNQTKFTATGFIRGRIHRGITIHGVEISTFSFTFGNRESHVLILFQHSGPKRLNVFIDGATPTVAIIGKFNILDHGGGQTAEISCNEFDGEEDANSHEVEHIMDCRSSKRTFQLVTVSHLTQSNNGTGHGSTDVCSL
jgi:hypothetical protein